MNAKKASLESAFTEIETLIDKMDSKQLSLEDSLKCFEKGVKLIHQCQKELKTAEQKIQKLSAKEEPFSLSNFLSDSQDEDV